VPEGELDKLALDLLGRVGLSCQPPGTLVPLARSLGADCVVWGDFGARPQDGLLETVDDRILIRIRRDQYKTRQRFTLAHEIGHLVLVQPDFYLAAMRRRNGLENDERFCDALAAALLMPADWIEDRYTARPRNFTTLSDCSKATETSLTASLLRLKTILGWTSSLLHWRRKDRIWRLVGMTGVPQKVRFRLGTPETTQRLLSDLEPGNSCRLEMPLGTSAGLSKVPVEVRVHRASVIGLVNLGSKSMPRPNRQPVQAVGSGA
jgi:IrrE N-terminal-like domain